MPELYLLIPSFIAGILMFFAPCTLPLLPGYIAYISGISASDYDKDQSKVTGMLIGKIFIQSVFFLLGFLAIFVGMGIIVRLGLISLQTNVLQITTGLVITFFGLFLLLQYFQKIPLTFLQSKKISLTSINTNNSIISSFLFGSAFAFGWSPCIGPILASIFLLSAQTETLLEGTVLLLIFSIGFIIPFLLLSLLISFGITGIGIRIKKAMKYVTLVSAILLIIIGVLILFGQYDQIMGAAYRLLLDKPTSWIYKHF